MSYQSGYGGHIKVGAATVAETQDWSGDIKTAMIDVTTQKGADEGFDRYAPGTTGGTASVNALWDMSDTAGQKALQTAALGRLLVDNVQLMVNDTMGYSGKAYVSGLQIKSSTKDVAKVTFNIQFTGTIGVVGMA